MRSERRMEIKVGLFLNLAIALALLAIWILGGTHNLFSRQNSYTLSLESAEGLTQGSKVMIAGVQAGRVDSFHLDTANRQVRVVVRIDNKFAHSIRQDSTAEVLTEGVLGDRVVSLTAGSQSSPELQPGQEIPARPVPSINQIIVKGDRLLVTLNQIADHFNRIINEIQAKGRTKELMKQVTDAAQGISVLVKNLNREVDGIQLKSAVKRLDSILAKIDRGNGTLGGLINDPVLYDDMKALIGEANSNRVVRNLVRKSVKDSEEKSEQAGTAAKSKK